MYSSSWPTLTIAYIINGYCNMCRRTQNVHIRLLGCTRSSRHSIFAYGIKGLFARCVSHKSDRALSVGSESIVKPTVTKKISWSYFDALEETQSQKIAYQIHQDDELIGHDGQHIYGRLSSSRSPRDSLKYFGISISRHIRFAGMRKNKSNKHILGMNM